MVLCKKYDERGITPAPFNIFFMAWFDRIVCENKSIKVGSRNRNTNKEQSTNAIM